MSVINSLDWLQSKDKKEQKDQIFKYVKSIWPKYDVNKKEQLDYEETKVFFNEQLGSLIDSDLKRKTPVFSDAECREMFAKMDKDHNQSISRPELAQFMMHFINNRESFVKQSEYMNKMKELKSYIDQQINSAVGQLK